MRLSLKQHLLILLGFLVLSLLMTWPLGFSAERYVLDQNLDQTAGLYNLWWFYYATIKLHILPWWNPLINFPDGYSMVFFPVQVPYGLFSLPFQIWMPHPLGLNLAYNLALVLSFTLAGYFTFLLVRDLTGSSRAGFLAGLIFTFAPFHFWHLSRPHVVATEFVVLAVLFFLRLLHSERLRPALGLGLALTLLAYASPTYLIYFFLFAGLTALFYLFSDRPALLRASRLRQIPAVALIFLPLFLPLLYLLLRDYLGRVVPLTPEESDPRAYSGNLLGYFLPGFTQRIYHPLMSLLPRVLSDLKRPYGVGGYEIFIGYIPLALALLAAIRLRPKGIGLWVWTALIFFALSLGPSLHLGEHTFTSLPLPQVWLSALVPIFREDRSPVRYFVFAELAVAVLAGFGLAELGKRLRAGTHLALTVALGILVLAEFEQAPLTLSQIPVPAFYQRLAEEPGDFAVLDLPLLPDVYRYSGTFQRWHHKRLVIDLTGRATDQRALYDPLFRCLDIPARFFVLGPAEQARAKKQIREEMAGRRLRYVVLFRKFLSPEQETRLVRLLRALGPVAELQEKDLFIIFQFAELSQREPSPK